MKRMKAEKIAARRTWRPRTLGLMFLAAVCPFFLATERLAAPISSVRQGLIFSGYLVVPLAISVFLFIVTGMKKGHIRVDADGVWWELDGYVPPLIPEVAFSESRIFRHYVSSLGGLVPPPLPRYMLVLDFGHKNIVILLRDQAQTEAVVAQITAELEARHGPERIRQGDGHVEVLHEKARIEPQRNDAGLAMILFSLFPLIVGACSLIYFVVYRDPGAIVGLLFGMVGVNLAWNGVRIRRGKK
jgi:hypothetical protein